MMSLVLQNMPFAIHHQLYFDYRNDVELRLDILALKFNLNCLQLHPILISNLGKTFKAYPQITYIMKQDRFKITYKKIGLQALNHFTAISLRRCLEMISPLNCSIWSNALQWHWAQSIKVFNPLSLKDASTKVLKCQFKKQSLTSSLSTFCTKKKKNVGLDIVCN